MAASLPLHSDFKGFVLFALKHASNVTIVTALTTLPLTKRKQKNKLHGNLKALETNKRITFALILTETTF